MSFETKEIYVGTVQRKAEEIELRKNFGWRYVRDESYGRSAALHIVLERDKEMKNYSSIASLENNYDNLKKQLKKYYPITDSPEMFLLILIFVFPFVIYCLYKSGQKKEIAENNAKLHKQMDEILKQAKELL